MLCIECYRPEELQLLDSGSTHKRRRSNSFTKKTRKFSDGKNDMELPLVERRSMKKNRDMKASVARKLSKKNDNPYLNAARNLEAEIDNRVSKAIILNEREPKASIIMTERDFFDAKSIINDIPSNQQITPVNVMQKGKIDFGGELHETRPQSNTIVNKDSYQERSLTKLPTEEPGVEAVEKWQPMFYENRPTESIFKETTKEQEERVRRQSPFGHL